MPDLNLKGREDEWGGRSSEGDTKPHKKAWWIALASGLIVLSLGVFVLLESKIIEYPTSEQISPAEEFPPPPDTIGAIIEQRDTILIDSLSMHVHSSSDSVVEEASTETFTETPVGDTVVRPYSVQVSAWQSEWKANEEVDRLSDFDLDAYVVRSEPDSAGRVWYRVRVGHYATFDQARRAAEKIVDLLEAGYTIEKEK